MVLDKNDQTCELLVVHVDDGVWAGSGTEFEQTQWKLHALINVKVDNMDPSRLLDDMTCGTNPRRFPCAAVGLRCQDLSDHDSGYKTIHARTRL